MKQIYFFESINDWNMFVENNFNYEIYKDYRPEIYLSRYETQQAIHSQEENIYTTDMSSLSNCLLIKGYQVFIKHVGQDLCEILIKNSGYTLPRKFTYYEVRPGQSIENMYKSDVFRL